MKYYSSKSPIVQGGGLLNSAINKLPWEVHIPGYNFCGPGTKLQERLARGDTGINLLDEACKEHDIAYSTHSALPNRHQADKILLKNALDRINAKDASWKEKLAAMGVSALMDTKLKLGMGHESRKKRRRDTNQNKKEDKCNWRQNSRKSTTKKKNMSTSVAKQITVVIKQSIKSMQHYLSKMETLRSQINGSSASSTSIRKRQKNKLTSPTTAFTRKRKTKKPQMDEEEEEHIDNYHEREMKKKIANRLPTVVPTTTKRKRKLENKQNLETELEKRLKQDMQQQQQKVESMEVGLINGQKRKRSDSEDGDLEGYEMTKKLKL